MIVAGEIMNGNLLLLDSYVKEIISWKPQLWHDLDLNRIEPGEIYSIAITPDILQSLGLERMKAGTYDFFVLSNNPFITYDKGILAIETAKIKVDKLHILQNIMSSIGQPLNLKVSNKTKKLLGI